MTAYHRFPVDQPADEAAAPAQGAGDGCRGDRRGRLPRLDVPTGVSAPHASGEGVPPVRPAPLVGHADAARATGWRGDRRTWRCYQTLAPSRAVRDASTRRPARTGGSSPSSPQTDTTGAAWRPSSGRGARSVRPCPHQHARLRGNRADQDAAPDPTEARPSLSFSAQCGSEKGLLFGCKGSSSSGDPPRPEPGRKTHPAGSGHR